MPAGGNVSKSIKITGLNAAKRMIKKQIMTKHNRLGGVVKRIGSDLLRKAQDNTPLQIGMLSDSGSVTVDNRGWGGGYEAIVGFDTPYAIRMHEAHYKARPKLTEQERIRRSTGAGGKKDVSNDRPSGGGLYGTRGRKFLTRAWFDNRARYRKRIKRIMEK